LEVPLKKYLVISCTLAVLTQPLMAQEIDKETCEPVKKQILTGPEAYREIYPFRPLPTEMINCRLKRLTENQNYLWDIREMNKKGLMRANTKVQPWGGSYWPLIQGQIANTYQDKDYTTYVRSGLELTSWKHNVSKFEKRKEKVHPTIYDLSEKELAELAPSEKYDVLLGDTSFDLTNRIWSFAATWGEKKKWGFLSSIELPEGYRVPEASKLMALWEGICHGWAIAAGSSPRPNRTVWVTLPNGKRMPFYPNDIKALVSLMWANSVVQDNVIVEGLRCNRKMPDKDEFGRYIDKELDKDDNTLMPRCADVHPAIYHTSIVNILGVEGRSFVVDKSAKASISNQPVSGYEYKYFHPETGKEGSFFQSLISINHYRKDPFRSARNPDARYIVGVDMILKYIDWEFPKADDTNYASNDKIGEMDFNYDLELDANFRIVGGQWRVKKNGNSRIIRNNTQQPDFFWVVPRDYKKFFEPVASLPKWDFKKSTLPPMEFQSAARVAHGFTYQMTKEFGWNEQCTVFPINKRDGGPLKVNCEFKYPRPQPLINVVEKLLEESRR
jgi:hypothetical protein